MSWQPLHTACPRKIAHRPLDRIAFRPILEQLESRELLATVLTYHNDLARTGQNLQETILTPSNVQPGIFGQLFTRTVDGQVYAQPLYFPGVPLPDGSVHDIVYVATEHDSVYAIDANDGSLLWQTSFLGSGDSPFSTSDAFGCGQISPELGITATPVIDPNTGLMYVVAQKKHAQGSTVTYLQTLHALDITTGQDYLPPVDIQASIVNARGQTVRFSPRHYKERAALTLSGGTLYTAWASHCDHTDANSGAPGWVIGYDASSLTQVSVFNTAPTGRLNTIWQGNGGLAVDPQGNLYFETGNGTGIHVAPNDNFSEAFLRLNGADGQTLDDFFIPFNYQALDAADRDLGSGAPIVLPDQPGAHQHLLVGAGKEGKIYLIDRDDMGGLNNPPTGPDLVVQSIPNALAGGSWDTPAYWSDGTSQWIYYAGNGDFVKAFRLNNGLLSANPTSRSPTHMTGQYGATPIVSANGTTNGLVWTLQNGSPATLHAYDATNLANELYDSNQVSTDVLGRGVKFNSSIVADGKVFVPGSNYVAVYGLLGTAAPRSVPKTTADRIALAMQNFPPIQGRVLAGPVFEGNSESPARRSEMIVFLFARTDLPGVPKDVASSVVARHVNNEAALHVGQTLEGIPRLFDMAS